MPPKPINYPADHHCSACRAKGSCSLPPQAPRVTVSYSETGNPCSDERGMGNPGQDLSITLHPQSTGAEPWGQAGKGLWGSVQSPGIRREGMCRDSGVAEGLWGDGG